MDRSTSGGFRFRRWGRLLAGTMSMALVAGCATNGREARLPPDQCSRSKARPANPNGSMLRWQAAQLVFFACASILWRIVILVP